MNSKDLIEKYGLRPNKALGQNFLVDEAAIDRIVRLACEPGLPILEIGPGLGALSFPLAGTGLPLAAVELDSVLAGILEKELPENARIVNADFLKCDLEGMIDSLGSRVTVVGNLPYYITSPIAMKLVTSHLPIERMVLMMQKEAADRFLAKPKDKNYVPLTIISDLLFDVFPAAELSRSSYYPQPEVESRVLVFDSKAVSLPDGFPRFLACAFSMRRKTLANNLAAMGVTKAAAEELLVSMGLAPSVRAEELSTREFVELFGRSRPLF